MARQMCVTPFRLPRVRNLFYGCSRRLDKVSTDFCRRLRGYPTGRSENVTVQSYSFPLIYFTRLRRVPHARLVVPCA